MDASLPALQGLRRSWGWLLVLGISLIVLGTVALGATVIATLASVLVFGVLLVIGGAVELVHAFRVRSWSGGFLHLIAGLLSLVAGFLLVSKPLVGSLSLTVLLAAYFLVSGSFRLFAALAYEVPRRGVALFGGAVTLILGLLIWSELPGAALWLIGMLLGIDMILRGWWAVVLALAVRRGAPA
jgi:uncharacterized membrane protein HdeD (DUF308 family)